MAKLPTKQVRNFFWKSASPPPKLAEFVPKLDLATQTLHRAYSDQDSQFLRRVGKVAQRIAPNENPGIRIHENVLSQAEMHLLTTELEPLMMTHGFTTLDPYAQAVYEAQMVHLRNPPKVNMKRITGRVESDKQVRAPWLYGDEFNINAVPPMLFMLIKRLFAIPGLKLGPVRDITINQRRHSYFRLDPHLDPTSDGENVMILSLSPTVITCSPLELLKQIESDAKAALDEARTLGFSSIEEKRAQLSYTPLDVDALVPTGCVCHLDADARWTWTHGTRLGVEKDGKLHDWFGTIEELYPREDTRFSVVVAWRSKPSFRVAWHV